MKIIKTYVICAFLTFGKSFLAYGQQTITLTIDSLPAFGGNAPGIFLAGDFNSWNPADSVWKMVSGPGKSWALSRQLPAAMYNFKVTRGSWQTVECGPTGAPLENRLIYLKHDTSVALKIAGWQDNFKQPEKKHTANPHVHVVSDRFDMPQLGRKRRVWIYLPKNYDKLKKRYPVIYMQDGQNLFDAYTSGYGEWGIDEILVRMPADKQCIIVGIDHGGENRITEYDPYGSKYGKGRGADYAAFLVQTLKPYVDAHYRTLKPARFTTVAGSSMGGLISMYSALKYPKIFGNAGIFSPAFWIAPEIYGEAKETPPAIGPRFYFVCGDSESSTEVAETQKMAAIIKLKKSGKITPVVIVKGARHNEAQWNEDFPDFYDWLIAGYSSK